MPRAAAAILLTDEERSTLMRWVRSPSQQFRLIERARVVLLTAAGRDNKGIAAQLEIPELRVGRWRPRLAAGRIDGLSDRKRSGRRRWYGHAERLEVVGQAVRPPEGETHWSTRRLSEHLAGSLGISKSHVHRVLHELDLKPHLVEQWLTSTDPDFEAKQADIVGLYLEPPGSAWPWPGPWSPTRP